MSTHKETFIGKIRSINGNVLTVYLDEAIKSTMPLIDGITYRVGQLGSFVRIPLGYAHLYGVVTQLGADAIPETLRDLAKDEAKDMRFATRFMSVVLIGERIGKKFERGVVQFPTTDDEVHLVTLDDLEIIYGGLSEENSVVVGNISVSESLPARIDIDKIVTRHSAIVGATGTGKSNAVAVILEAIAQGPFKSARVLIIDPHGEYDESLVDYSKVFKINADEKKNQSELHIPYWALPFNEFISIFPGHLNDQQKDYIREKITEKKISANEKLAVKSTAESTTADSPIPFSIKQLWFDLDDFERQTFLKEQDQTTKETKLVLTNLSEKGDVAKLKSNKYQTVKAGINGPFLNQQLKGILGFLDTVKNRLLDQRFRFLFQPGDWEPGLDGSVKKDLDSLLQGWLGHEKPISILDLSGIPPEIMVSVSGSLLKIIFDGAFWAQNLPVGGREQPILLVLEEAHNYLKAGENSIASRTVQAIAKEGRKYGVGLMLVTQRPSELDETVLSQCGTLFALRMTNKGDRGHISSAVQDELYEIIGILPSLRTGEGLIIGEGVKIPSRVKFDRIAKAPKSTDPAVSKQWKQERPDSKHYPVAVKLWRNQKFNQ